MDAAVEMQLNSVKALKMSNSQLVSQLSQLADELRDKEKLVCCVLWWSFCTCIIKTRTISLFMSRKHCVQKHYVFQLFVSLWVCLCILNNIVNTIFWKVLDIFSLNFEHWCTLEQRWMIEILGKRSKFKVTAVWRCSFAHIYFHVKLDG